MISSHTAGEKPAVALAEVVEVANVTTPRAADWQIFPIVPGGKAPLTDNGFHAATDDPAQIEAWRARWPDCNWAVACGESGLTVVDIDGPDGEAAWEEFQIENGYAPATLEVRTTRPEGGRHLYFKSGAKWPKNPFSKYVDIQSAGSYVLLPGARIEGRPGRSEVTKELPLAPFPYTFAAKERKERAAPGIELGHRLINRIQIRDAANLTKAR
jgi:hypothetical protein